MSDHLTPGQRALLEAALVLRQHELDRQLGLRQGGLGRAEHAREVLLQDGDDAPQRDSEREVDQALSDQGLRELGAVSDALRRLHTPAYGQCADCGTSIPFRRLEVEPWALRCVPCESRREAPGAGTPARL
jgi:DnaK suppressor protein